MKRAVLALGMAAACAPAAPKPPPTPTTVPLPVSTAAATAPPPSSAPEAGGAATPVVRETVPPATDPPEGNAGAMAQQLAAIRACESGNRYDAVSRSGRHRGAWQFDQRTWDGVARRHRPELVGHDPAAAAPADQDAMAGWLYDERGGQPWPNCA